MSKKPRKKGVIEWADSERASTARWDDNRRGQVSGLIYTKLGGSRATFSRRSLSRTPDGLPLPSERDMGRKLQGGSRSAKQLQRNSIACTATFDKEEQMRFRARLFSRSIPGKSLFTPLTKCSTE